MMSDGDSYKIEVGRLQKTLRNRFLRCILSVEFC
uniref:Uncharacterized protein n=1 Tax=Lepeophtheirus salmonis TaxID=72036 RepID=A0A0K2T2L7_LEPSM